ncbi:TPA: hypothetical protein SLU70_001472 [Pseudomonas aeruginosa]|nr:hypothetical protein [Pseudomonas aeruginosa]
MEQAMREEFEAWVRTQVPEPSLATVLAYSAGNDLYLNTHIQGRYEGWKASRAALRVELPEVGSAPDGAKYDLGFGDPKFAHDYREHQVSAAMRQLCREALQQAGIEVK